MALGSPSQAKKRNDRAGEHVTLARNVFQRCGAAICMKQAEDALAALG